MTDLTRMVADLLARVPQLDQLRRDAESGTLGRLAEEAREVRVWLERLDGALHPRQDADLSAERDIRDIRRGVAAARAAIQLEPARRALEDVERLLGESGRPPGKDVLVKALVIHLRIGHRQCLAALPALSEAEWGDVGPARPATGASGSRERPRSTEGAGGGQPLHLDVLRSVATYHREHERYYTMYGFERAAEMSRDANRLKVVADVWLRGPASPPTASVDYADPRHQAAGCEDLNALSAIASIGVLFMEGEGEPAEIRALRAKLRGMSMGFHGSGQWLADKMKAAWERERALFSPALVDAAWPRFLTIVTNWCGARRTMLAGRLLGLVEDVLATIDFTPAAVRQHRAAYGGALQTAGWILDLTAQSLAESAADLADNDPRWTEYRAVLDRTVRPAT